MIDSSSARRRADRVGADPVREPDRASDGDVGRALAGGVSLDPLISTYEKPAAISATAANASVR